MSQTKFFAKNITHLTDARYFAAMGVDWMSFDLGPKGISLAAFNAIVEWVEGPLIAIQELETDEEIDQVHKIRLLDQIDPNDDQILYINATLFGDIPYDLQAQAILLKAESKKDVIQLKSKIKSTDISIYLESDLNNEELIDICREIPGLGLVVNGSDEEKTGFKDFELIDELFEALS